MRCCSRSSGEHGVGTYLGSDHGRIKRGTSLRDEERFLVIRNDPLVDKLSHFVECRRKRCSKSNNHLTNSIKFVENSVI